MYPEGALPSTPAAAAGLRINPDTFSRSRMSYYLSGRYAAFTDDLSIPLDEGHGQSITGIPDGYWINYVTWSPEGTHIAFTLRSAGGLGDPPAGPLELWVADVKTGAARRLMAQRLNTVFEDYSWIDDDTIVAAVLPEGLAPPPAKPAVPLGPRIEDNSSGRKSQARTYPDLLASDHDEKLFEHYGTSQLVTVKVHQGAPRRAMAASTACIPGGALNSCRMLTGTRLLNPQASSGEVKLIGDSRLYTATSSSPDGRFLLVSWLERPFSYALPCGRFPKRVQLWDRCGGGGRVGAAT